MKNSVDPIEEGAIDEAKQQVAATRTRLQTTARRVADRLREGGAEILEDRKTLVARKIGDAERTVRDTAQSLASNQQLSAAEPLHTAADRVGSLAAYIESRTPAQLLDEAADTLRKHPVIVAGGAIALGLAIGRFLKATSH